MDAVMSIGPWTECLMFAMEYEIQVSQGVDGRR